MNTMEANQEARIPLLLPEDMSSEQYAVYAQVLSGKRKQFVGPLRAAIHSPDLASRWSQFGEFLRFDTCLPGHLKELAIVCVGRRWTAQVEWSIHAEAAEKAGLPTEVIDAIRMLESPQFTEEAAWEIYEFTRHLQEFGKIPAPLHDAIKQRWGVRGVVELAALVGYYSMVAMTLNAHEIPLMTGEPELPESDGLQTLPPARLA